MQTASSSTKSGVVRASIVAAVIVRPSLWLTCLVQASRLVPHGWWRTAPFLPFPSSDYIEFRLVTQYGGGHGVTRGAVQSKDVVDYLKWCRRWNDEN